MKIGYARCSTARQDTSVQIGLLAKIGIERYRVYTDHAAGKQNAPASKTPSTPAAKATNSASPNSTDSPDQPETSTKP